MLRTCFHYGIHILIPVLIAFLFYRKSLVKSAVILLSAIVIDIDHLLATPIFDANRCSIGFHPLHTYAAILCYLILFLIPKTRIIGLGLLIHIIADTVDCWMMNY